MPTRYYSLKTILPALLLSCILFACNTGSNAKQVQKELEIAAQRQNESCPIIIDEVTRLDSCKATNKHILEYYYTLVANQLFDSTEFKLGQEVEITNNLKLAKGMQFYKTNKITMRYIYYNQEGRYLCLIEVSPEKYKE